MRKCHRSIRWPGGPFALAETAGSEVLEGLVQRRDKPDASTYIGSGKAIELRDFRRLGRDQGGVALHRVDGHDNRHFPDAITPDLLLFR